MARYATAREEDKLKCIRCGSANQAKDFYATKDPKRRFYGKIPYCKECIRIFYEEYFKKNNENCNLAMYYLCRKIDIPYNHSCFLGAMENINNTNARLQGEDAVVSAYIKGLGFAEQNGWGTSFDDSQGEGEIEGITSFAELTKVKRSKMYSNPTENDDRYDVIEYDTQELMQKWGNFDIDDLAYLESEYLDWEEKLDGITEKSIDIMVKQICLQLNEIRKARENEESVDKQIKTLQDLLKNSGLIEKQKSVNEFKQIGMLIKDIEFKKPIRTVDEDLSDVDNVRDIILGITGGVCRSLCTENFYTNELDRIYGKYGIEFIEEQVQDRKAEIEESELGEMNDDS